jgi:DNA polymerase III delta prime subunit
LSTLVLLGGPPGVGKTTTLRRLPRLYERCALLDADDVWRVHPFEVNDVTRSIAEGNVIAVLRGFLEARYPIVFLAWVLANPRLIERILGGLQGCYDDSVIVHLVASRETLQERSQHKFERGLIPEYQLFKLQQIEALPFPKIDTTTLTTAEVAERIGTLVERGQAQPELRDP